MKSKKWILLINLSIMLMLILTACGGLSSAKPNFPTGKFALPESDGSEGINFNEDGTWTAFYYGADVANGTYSVKGDLYIEESNNWNCGKSPMSFRYTFDGANLKFELTEESKNDICENRRNGFNGITYVLVK